MSNHVYQGYFRFCDPVYKAEKALKGRKILAMGGVPNAVEGRNPWIPCPIYFQAPEGRQEIYLRHTISRILPALRGLGSLLFGVPRVTPFGLHPWLISAASSRLLQYQNLKLFRDIFVLKRPYAAIFLNGGFGTGVSLLSKTQKYCRMAISGNNAKSNGRIVGEDLCVLPLVPGLRRQTWTGSRRGAPLLVLR